MGSKGGMAGEVVSIEDIIGGGVDVGSVLGV